jgi:RNA polymerase sigma factor for flagellar operon FliA
MSVVGQRFGWRCQEREGIYKTKDGHMSTMTRKQSSLSEVEQSTPIRRHGRMMDSNVEGRRPPRAGRSIDPHIQACWDAWIQHRCLDAKQSLTIHYMRTHVRPIAERMRSMLPGHIEVDDLVQQGYLGLEDAMDRFDPGQGVKFETFSSRRIGGSMQDWLRSLDHVPRLMRRRAKIVQQQVDLFLARFGRHPDANELRATIDVGDAEYDRIIGEDAPPVVVTISTASGGDEDDPVCLPERHTVSPSRASQRRDLRQWITRDLNDVDQMIVSLYYYESLTMREVGITVGCSESRVSQRLDSILQRLRARIDLTPDHLMTMAG